MRARARKTVGVLAALVVFLGTLSGSPAAGSLVKPAYSVGDRWLYVLTASLGTLPGFNETGGTFEFGLVGQVQVEVTGLGQATRGTTTYHGFNVESHTSGFLNGTFSFPGLPGTATVTGTFSSSTEDFWEEEGFLPISSRSNTSYDAELSLGISTPLRIDIRLVASSAPASIPPFNLDVGQSATIAVQTQLDFNSTVTVLGQTTSSANSTEFLSQWRREVVARQTVAVEAGVFDAYALNQTAGAMPAVPFGGAQGNETAYFSNDVGFFVKRVAYENDTPVAEMRLKSYSYAAGPRSTGWGLGDVLLILIPVAAGVAVLLVLWRRRPPRGRTSTLETGSQDVGLNQVGGQNAR